MRKWGISIMYVYIGIAFILFIAFFIGGPRYVDYSRKIKSTRKIKNTRKKDHFPRIPRR